MLLLIYLVPLHYTLEFVNNLPYASASVNGITRMHAVHSVTLVLWDALHHHYHVGHSNMLLTLRIGVMSNNRACPVQQPIVTLRLWDALHM